MGLSTFVPFRGQHGVSKNSRLLSELRSSSTPDGVVRERGDFSTPSCASLARGYQNVSPFGDRNKYKKRCYY